MDEYEHVPACPASCAGLGPIRAPDYVGLWRMYIAVQGQRFASAMKDQ